MTGTDVVENARILCDDVDETTWEDDTFLAFVNEGVRRLFDEQPVCRLKDNGTLRDYSKAAALTETLLVEDQYLIALTEYVCYRFFDSDSGDSRDKDRADEHLKNFLFFTQGG